MALIPGPYEIMELAPDQEISLHVVSFLLGEQMIVPTYAGAPPTKMVPDLRVFLVPGTKATGPAYYDLTAGTLVHQVQAILSATDRRPVDLKIRKVGVAPKARYQVTIVPPPVAAPA